jgi:hypothetical protein
VHVDKYQELLQIKLVSRLIPDPFAKFLKENDTIAQYLLTYEPQQNDVAERRNHTLMNMVCNMLSNSMLP